MKTKQTFRFLYLVLFVGFLFSCENNEDELIDLSIDSNVITQNDPSLGKSNPSYGDFIYGDLTNPRINLPNSNWYYTIQHKVNRINGEFIHPDGIQYIGGASVGSVVVITADQSIPSGWIVIDGPWGEIDEYGEPEKRKKYLYLVIQYQG